MLLHEPQQLAAVPKKAEPGPQSTAAGAQGAGFSRHVPGGFQCWSGNPVTEGLFYTAS
jgi:hypothetical protein